jgi:catalase
MVMEGSMMRAMNLAVGLILAALAGLAGGGAMAQSAPDALSVAVQTIDTMNKLWGRHPGLRANHAKGVVVMGSFTPARRGPRSARRACSPVPAFP